MIHNDIHTKINKKSHILKFIVCKSLIDLDNILNSQNLIQQLNNLLQNSFPLQLPMSSSFVENMKLMVKKKHIDPNNVITILAIIPTHTTHTTHTTRTTHSTLSVKSIVGCVQIVIQSNTYTIINLCRIKGDRFRGIGKYLLKYSINHIRKISNVKIIYLSVSANNTKLQEYYQKLGWVKTHEYDFSSDTEPAFKMMYIL